MISMGKPSALLYRADPRSGQGNNDNLTLLSPTLFYIHTLSGTQLEGNGHNILKIRQSLQHDVREEQIAMVVWDLNKDKVQWMMKSAEWLESDRLLMFRGKIYFPKDRNLRHCIIEQYHNTHIAGHAGCFKTLKIISRNYWWPQMSRYIRLYIKTCN
jgi:hypothetical protein